MFQINVGLMDEQLRPRRVQRQSVRVLSVATASEIIDAAVLKMSCHNRHFDKEVKYKLCYPDGKVVHVLPETEEIFTLERYKEQIMKDYSKISLYLATEGSCCQIINIFHACAHCEFKGSPLSKYARNRSFFTALPCMQAYKRQHLPVRTAYAWCLPVYSSVLAEF